MYSIVKSTTVFFLLLLSTPNCVNSSGHVPGGSCYNRDSCGYNKDPLKEGKICECDATCYRRGTCCMDSVYVDPRPSTRSETCSRGTTVGVGYNFYFQYSSGSISHSFFQRAKCDSSWRGPIKVKQSCEVGEPLHGADFMVAIPVTNIYNGITYKNYFCALCNNDVEGSVLWDVSIFEREEPGREISDRFAVLPAEEIPDMSSDYTGSKPACTPSDRCALPLQYNKYSDTYQYYFSSEGYSVKSVTVNLTIPEQIQHLVKGCRTDLISCCSPDWTDVRVKVLCESYMGIIKGPLRVTENDTTYDQYFRNAHCAQCNNVTDFDGYYCETFSPTLFSAPSYQTSESIRFRRLLSDTGCLGNNAKFVSGLSCRSAICTNPQHKVKNGKCAPAHVKNRK